MKVDIQPQWKKLADWYWEEFNPQGRTHLSIWDILAQDFGARRAFNIANVNRRQMWVIFPDEKSYTAFLLRWS